MELASSPCSSSPPTCSAALWNCSRGQRRTSLGERRGRWRELALAAPGELRRLGRQAVMGPARSVGSVSIEGARGSTLGEVVSTRSGGISAGSGAEPKGDTRRSPGSALLRAGTSRSPAAPGCPAQSRRRPALTREAPRIRRLVMLIYGHVSGRHQVFHRWRFHCDRWRSR